MRGVVVYMRGLALFVAGIVVGTFLMQSSAAQENRDAGFRLNHIGIAVKEENFDKTLNFYTKVMGFRLAWQAKFDTAPGQQTYLQINRDTFLEMGTARGNQPEGITHFGIVTPDVKATVARLRQAGATVQDVRLSGPTKALLSGINDPTGIHIELLELTPESLHKKAEEAWK